ncbi:MAG: NAD(P)-dependent alcohol dehydrogenase [Alcaligenaceae bacterium]|nr:NAD(P)-dependent alcohol dehydrogenase [Alcaligenaceae bacterium]
MQAARSTMSALEAQAFSIDRLQRVERPIPTPGPGEILIRVRAASLNYRDLAILSGVYLPNLPLPYVPASDACGVVAETGEGVTRFAVDDRVMPCYIQGWRDGAPTAEQRQKRTLGAPLTGVLQEYVVVPAEDAVAAPPHLSDAEAATLPIAALTAWSCLLDGGIKVGSNVLVQGTGGVALFALQLAKVAGARVVALTSSNLKAEVLRKLGADAVINYKETPEWAGAVKEATQGRGADIILETTGSTIPQSLGALAFGGFIGVIGFVGGYETSLNIRQIIGPIARIQGISVGSRARFESLVAAMALHRIKPVIDSSYDLDHTADAFRHMQQGKHIGKIVVTL